MGGVEETLKPTACCIIDKEVVIAHTWEEEGRGQKQEKGYGREGWGGGARQTTKRQNVAQFRVVCGNRSDTVTAIDPLLKKVAGSTCRRYQLLLSNCSSR